MHQTKEQIEKRTKKLKVTKQINWVSFRLPSGVVLRLPNSKASPSYYLPGIQVLNLDRRRNVANELDRIAKLLFPLYFRGPWVLRTPGESFILIDTNVAISRAIIVE